MVFVLGSISIVYIAQSPVKLEKQAFLSTKGDRKRSWGPLGAGMLGGGILSVASF